MAWCGACSAWTWTGQRINAVFPRGQVQSPKVRAFVDFLVERLNFDSDYMRELCEEGERCQQLTTAAIEVEGAIAGAELERLSAHRPARQVVVLTQDP